MMDRTRRCLFDMVYVAGKLGKDANAPRRERFVVNAFGNRVSKQ